MHVNKPRTLIVKEEGLAPVFLDSCLEHPAGWICVCYESSVLLLLLLLLLLRNVLVKLCSILLQCRHDQHDMESEC